MRYFSSELARMPIFKYLFIESKLNEQSCLGGTVQQKLFTLRIIIPPKWDLKCVKVRSHLSGMNPFSYWQIVFLKWDAPFCQDLIQVRHLIWVGWFFSDKQLLNHQFILVYFFHEILFYFFYIFQFKFLTVYFYHAYHQLQKNLKKIFFSFNVIENIRMLFYRFVAHIC